MKGQDEYVISIVIIGFVMLLIRFVFSMVYLLEESCLRREKIPRDLDMGNSQEELVEQEERNAVDFQNQV